MTRSCKIASAVVALLVVLGVVVLREPLVRWFTGESSSGAGAAVATRAGPFSLSAALAPDPPTEKNDALVLDVRDASGKPVDDASIDVVYDMPAMGSMSEMKGGAEVTHEGSGRYRARFDFPMGGTWRLEVSVRSPSGTGTQTFQATVGSAGLSVIGGATPPASARAVDVIASVAFPPGAFDPLRASMDALDRARKELARDETAGVPADARTIAEALRTAAGAMPKDRPKLAGRASRAAADADRLAAAASIDASRAAFADLNRDLLPLYAADARLTAGWHLFQCPMAHGARWAQRDDVAENPFLGSKMPTCGDAQSWEAPSATTAPTPEQAEQGAVSIDAARRQLIGVRTASVIEGPMRDEFRAVGRVAYDESALTDVNLRVHGWITKLFVSQTGQRVARGQTLFTMYSPELYNAQQDFLLATRGAIASSGDAGTGSASLATATRQRLRLLGMDDAAIDAVAKKSTPTQDVAVPAPASGFVVEKNLVEGAAVEPGMRLYRIAALSRVWVEAEVYESDMARVRVGQIAKVTLDYLPGRAFDAKLAYVYPYLDSKTRTGRVRLEIDNRDLDLRPGMYATVAIGVDLGTRVQVPAGAVVYTGPRRIVFVDLGDGRFQPREVTVGTEAGGMYEVRSGLRPGERVAVSGVFLIAAEARLRTATTYWTRAPEADGGAP